MAMADKLNGAGLLLNEKGVPSQSPFFIIKFRILLKRVYLFF